MSIRILSLDCGTKTGWSIGYISGVEEFPVKRGESPGMRFLKFRGWLEGMFAVLCDDNRKSLESRAWAAGFYDGEGCVTVSDAYKRIYKRKDGTETTHKSKGIAVQITQAGKTELLEKFKDVVGGIGDINGPYLDKRWETAQERWQYRASGVEKTRHIAMVLWPWLGSVKKQQFKDKLEKKLISMTKKTTQKPYHDLVVIYEEAHHRGGAATQVCVGMVTTLLSACAEWGIETMSVHSGTLKKYATGKGNAGKPEMIAEAVRRGYDPVDDNEADAQLMLEYALETLGEICS